jgi:hypothetical protein
MTTNKAKVTPSGIVAKYDKETALLNSTTCRAQPNIHPVPVNNTPPPPSSMLKKFQHIEPCTPAVIHKALNLSPKSSIWHQRLPSHPSHPQPYVALAIVFKYSHMSALAPTFKLAMPMFYAENYVRHSLRALLGRTSGDYDCKQWWWW